MYTTVDSRKVGSKGLDNEGATKEPPPFLRIIRYIKGSRRDDCCSTDTGAHRSDGLLM